MELVRLQPQVRQFSILQTYSFGIYLRLDYGNSDIFFIMPPQYLRSHNRLPRLVLTALLRMLFQAGADRDRRVLFLLNEAANSLGKFDVLADAITQMRGFGLRMVPAQQALAQLEQMFPEGQHATILADTDQIYLNIRDWDTLEAVSKRLEETTVRTSNQGASGNTSHSEGAHASTTTSYGWSSGSSETGKPLLRPEDLAKLGDRAVVFLQDLPPLMVKTCPYYQDAAFAEAGSLTVKELLRCLSLMLLSFLAFCWAKETSTLNHPRGAAPQPLMYPPSHTAPPEFWHRPRGGVPPRLPPYRRW